MTDTAKLIAEQALQRIRDTIQFLDNNYPEHEGDHLLPHSTDQLSIDVTRLTALLGSHEAMRVALEETKTDLVILRGNVLSASKTDSRWEGMPARIDTWIKRHSATLVWVSQKSAFALEHSACACVDPADGAS